MSRDQVWVSGDRVNPDSEAHSTACTPQGAQHTAVPPRHAAACTAQRRAPGATRRLALKAFPMGVQGLAVPGGDMPPRSEIMSLWTAQPVKQCMPI